MEVTTFTARIEAGSRSVKGHILVQNEKKAKFDQFTGAVGTSEGVLVVAIRLLGKQRSEGLGYDVDQALVVRQPKK